MSSHEIFLRCNKCRVVNSVYTGDSDPHSFTNSQWEGSFIDTICDTCLEGEIDE